MKQILRISIWLVMVLQGGTLLAQQTADTSLAPCYGNTNRPILTTENAMIFNLAGINLNKYNWKNSVLNCHINSALDHSTKFRNKRSIGFAGVSIGLSTLAGI